MNPSTKYQNWRKLIPILLVLCLTAILTLTSCITVNQPAIPPSTEPPQTQESKPIPVLPAPTPVPTPAPTPTPTQELPLPQIEAFIADPSYNPGGQQLAGLSDAKIAVDTAWQAWYGQTYSYYQTSPALSDQYKPWGISQLQEVLDEFKKTPWVSLYDSSYFCCRHMSALLQRELTIREFESWIVIGKDPKVSTGHAWVVVFLRSPSIQLVPVEATALEIPQSGKTYRFSNGVVQTYDDYSRQGWVLQDIYQAQAWAKGWWGLNDFGWWNKTNVLTKLGLPTLITTPTPAPVVPTPKPTQYTLSTSISPPGSGTVSLNPPGSTYDSGTRVSLTATAASGYYFVSWSGIPGSAPAPTPTPTPLLPAPITSTISIIMDSNKSVVANFARVILPYVRANSPTGLSSGKMNQTLTFSTTANTNIAGNPEYQFDWGDGSSSSWSSSPSASHSWANPGTYIVRAQARIAGFPSEWSFGNEVKIETESTATPQRIQYTMPGWGILGCVVSYTKECQAGERITGFVELTGTYYSVDWSYEWTFQILGPGGESVQIWKGRWDNSNHHDFSFTASYAGTYKIRVSHASNYPKNLVIEIQPPGWGYSVP